MNSLTKQLCNVTLYMCTSESFDISSAAFTFVAIIAISARSHHHHRYQHFHRSTSVKSQHHTRITQKQKNANKKKFINRPTNSASHRFEITARIGIRTIDLRPSKPRSEPLDHCAPNLQRKPQKIFACGGLPPAALAAGFTFTLRVHQKTIKKQKKKFRRRLQRLNIRLHVHFITTISISLQKS